MTMMVRQATGDVTAPPVPSPSSTAMSPPYSSAPPSNTTPAPAAGLPSRARIALFTVRSFAVEHAVPVIAAHPNAELACVVTTPGPKARRSDAHVQVVEALHRLGHASTDVVCTNRKGRWADLLALYGVNLVLVSGFPWLIPASVLDDPRLSLGVINFHNSHLPQFMGPNAFGWHVVSGMGSVGYCCHRMSAEFDTGPVLFTETVPLDVNEDYQDLKAKMPPVFRGMVERAIGLALAGDPGSPQSGEPSRAPKFADEFRWIDFGATAREVHDKVRAYYGERDHPRGALARLDDGSSICITKTFWRPPVKVVDGELPPRLASPPALSSSSPPLPPMAASAEQDPEMASLASLTTLGSESLTASSLDVVSGGGARTSSPSSLLPGGSSDHHGHVPFFVQCADTTLEVLEWHRMAATDDEEEEAAAAVVVVPEAVVAAVAAAAAEAEARTVRAATTSASAAGAPPAVAVADLFA